MIEQFSLNIYKIKVRGQNVCSIFNLVDYLKKKKERQNEQYLFCPNTFICPFNINTMKHTIFILKFEKKNMRAKRPTFKYKRYKVYGC